MDANLLRPKDEHGVPRRFRGHWEAFAWVAVSLARHGPRLTWAYISGGAVWLAWSLARRVFYGVPFDPLPPDWPFFVAMAVMFPLAAWILVSVVIYAYLALAGGVMRRDEM